MIGSDTIRTLRVIRNGYQLNSNRVGYVATVPPMELPEHEPLQQQYNLDDPAQLGALLGWSNPVPPGAGIDLVQPTGMVAPNRWERLYIKWLCDTLKAPLDSGFDVWPDPSGAPGPLSVARDLASDSQSFWKSPADLPQGVTLARAQSRRGEARHAARTIRAWLLEHDSGHAGHNAAHGWDEACDHVLVLLPPDPATVELWIDTFQRLDLPVRATTFSPLARSPFVRWVIDLAHLAGWSDGVPVPRFLLQRLLLSKFWSASTAAKSMGLGDDVRISRTMIANLLRSLRRPTVNLQEWKSHLETFGIDQRTSQHELLNRTALWKLSAALAKTLDPSHLASSVARMLSSKDASELDLGVSKALRSLHGSPDDQEPEPRASDPGALLERIRTTLTLLADKSAPTDNHWEQLNELTTTLNDQFVAERLDPVHGITFMPYAHYDHRKASLLVMAGLGEGLFPTVTGVPTDSQAAWLHLLGLLERDQRAPAWVVHDVEQQIATARAALMQAQQAMLSFSTQGPGTEELHPGALLSLLAGSWSDTQWASQEGQVALLPAGTDIPKHPADAAGWTEARLFAGDPTARAQLIQAAQADDVAVEKARQLDTLESALGTSRQADAQRRPQVPTPAGPFTGRLPGAIAPSSPSPQGPQVYSPTSLEQYAQCPYRYFLGRVLRLDSVGDADDNLDHRESGSTVHAAFAQATRQAVADHPDNLWDFTYPCGLTPQETKKNKEVKIAEVMATLQPAVSSALADITRQQPTISQPLLIEMGRRWTQAIRNWVTTHVQERIPVPMDDAAIDASPEVAQALERLAEVECQLAELFDEFSDEVRSGRIVTAKDRVLWAERFSKAGGGGTKGEIDKCLTPHTKTLVKGTETEKTKALADLIEPCTSLPTKKLTELVEKARQSERHRRAKAPIAHKVAFAEFSFGRAKDTQSDPNSLEAPWRALCPQGKEVLLKGQIDRIDWDHDRKALAIRDYKSGEKKSARKLEAEMRLGLHLQLLLYACAVEDLLVDSGTMPMLANHRVGEIALEFPKEEEKKKTAEIDFSAQVPVAETPDDDPASTDAASEPAPEADQTGSSDRQEPTYTSWRQVALTWLGYLIGSLEQGRFDLIPQACPLVKDKIPGYCDYKRICRLSPDHAHLLTHDHPRPDFPKPEKETAPEKGKEAGSKKGGKSPDKKVPEPPSLISPKFTGVDTKPEEDRITHEKGSALAKNLDHDVVVSAGAGTGKTYNLVQRYLAALDAGVAPEQILCVTFTRKAASEMRQRVRAALLERAAKSQDGVQFSKVRSSILTLSAAPIWTLDSLALHLLKALHDAQPQGPGKGAPPAVDSDAAAAELEQFLSDRFLKALADDDPDIRFLLDHISVTPLRNAIKSIVSSSSTLPPEAWPTSPEDLFSRWGTLLAQPLEKIRDHVRKMGINDWESCFEADKSFLSEDSLAKMQDGISGAKRLAGKNTLTCVEILSDIRAMQRVQAAQSKDSLNYVGNKTLYEWLTTHVPSKLITRALGKDTAAATAVNTLVNENNIDLAAQVAFRQLELCRRWAAELEERLLRRGTLRYSDVETAALRALSDDQQSALLKQHLPFKHIFVDESQDTSERQARLVDRLATLTGARLFWVGDPKQSIFRFRGAEVDIFEERVKVTPTLASLRVNRRSNPRLIEAVNRLFGAMFEARTTKLSPSEPGGEAPTEPASAIKKIWHLDPGSEVSFEPQTWPETRKKQNADGAEIEVPWVLEEEEARIEWIVENSAAEVAKEKRIGHEQASESPSPDGNDPSWHNPKRDDEAGRQENSEAVPQGDDEDDGDQDQAPTRQSTSAVAVRIRQILNQFKARGQEPPSGHIAILAFRWWHASQWSKALQAEGIPCAVQGGRGLLQTPEADLLQLWLEAVLHGDEVALAGVLRGPGVALSDAGLYCLRKGYGVTPVDFAGQPTTQKPPFRLGRAVTWPFNPIAAVEDWSAASELANPTLAMQLLSEDARSLERFRLAWGNFAAKLQTGSTADALAWLTQQLALDAYWCTAEGKSGRQVVANMTAVLDYVREYEASHGSSPFDLLRHIEQVAGSEDPAAGGLDAGVGTPVVITTVWMAKGREWPVVVLPELARFKVKSDEDHAGLRRVMNFDLRDGARLGTLYVPEVALTTPNSPFTDSLRPVTPLLNLFTAPVVRAELRRLLYVAMTRAKERLIMTGGYKPESCKATVLSGEDGVKCITINSANTWAQMIGMCTQLKYEPVLDDQGEPVREPDGQPQTRPTLGPGAWRSGEDVLVRTTDEVLAQATDTRQESHSPGFDPKVVQLWRPVKSKQRKRENPSRQKAAAQVPQPWLGEAQWPKSRAPYNAPFKGERDAGIAFHKLMELWGFGTAGLALDQTLATAALHATGLGAPATRQARCKWLVDTATRITQANPSLVAQLHAAAAQGNVYHEVPLQYTTAAGDRVEGIIDLLWRDAEGWHLLDYKAGSDYPHGPAAQTLRHENLREHFAQVSLYVEGLTHILPDPLKDFGIWYIAAALPVRWST